jgi:hypothetical protein
VTSTERSLGGEPLDQIEDLQHRGVGDERGTAGEREPPDTLGGVVHPGTLRGRRARGCDQRLRGARISGAGREADRGLGPEGLDHARGGGVRGAGRQLGQCDDQLPIIELAHDIDQPHGIAQREGRGRRAARRGDDRDRERPIVGHRALDLLREPGAQRGGVEQRRAPRPLMPWSR